MDAARLWIERSLVEDSSLFTTASLWTPIFVEDVRQAFVDHPDDGDEGFIQKLKKQLALASPDGRKLAAEILWSMLLFPGRMKAATKRQQILEIYALSGESLEEKHPLLSDAVLGGIGSAGPAYSNYRPAELEYVIGLIGQLKALAIQDRKPIFASYEDFVQWIDGVSIKGNRQFRHMLRYFAFPDRVERIASNNDRRRILDKFNRSSLKATETWSDLQLDTALFSLRSELQEQHPGQILDFYEPPLRDKWQDSNQVVTTDGPAAVVIPSDDDEDTSTSSTITHALEERPSIKVQAKLAEIGAIMGLRVWIPAADRARVSKLMSEKHVAALLDHLPWNADNNTLATVKQIDVLWLRKQTILRAFEVEHTTAVYSGLLRMADLIALQPNLNIPLHIVAPDERREKVFQEMLRPVFQLLDGGPLSKTCTFLSYENVDAIRKLEALAHVSDKVLGDYEERAEDE